MAHDGLEAVVRKERSASRKRHGTPSVGDGGNLRGFPSFYRIPKVGEPRIPLLLTRGDYVNKILSVEKEELVEEDPYFYSASHYVPSLKGAKKGSPFLKCGAGIAEYQGTNGLYLGVGTKKCVLCYQYQVHKSAPDNLPKDKKPLAVGKGNVSRVYSAVLLAWYHRIPTGRKNKNGYETFFHELCKGKTCKLCEDENNKKYFGRSAYIELGQNHSKNLDMIEDETIGRICACGGEITTKAFRCPHCKWVMEVSWDLLDLEDKNRLVDQPQRCSSCREVDHFDELIGCSKCKEPTPLSIWNLVLWLERSGEGYDSALTLKQWANPVDYFNNDEEMLNLLNELRVPVERDKTHSILSLDMQARKLGIPNPFVDEDTTAEFEERRSKKSNGSSSKPERTWDDDPPKTTLPPEKQQPTQNIQSIWDDDDIPF